MTRKVRKVVIPIAGFGTRFLPATKAMPKEMLPVIDKPVIQYVVEEAVAAGMTDVILVTSHTKRPVEDHFDKNPELEAWLAQTGKRELLKEIRGISALANFIYVRQKGPYGNATPVLNAEHLINGEPFAVLFADEIFFGKKSRLRQMLDVFEAFGDPVMGVVKTDDEGTRRYGIIDPAKKVAPRTYPLRGFVEKPGPKKAPSRLASIGAYILTPDIFLEMRRLKPGHNGEYVLGDAISSLMKSRSVYACELQGDYYDTGSKIGWLKANVALALQRPDLAKDMRSVIRSLGNVTRRM